MNRRLYACVVLLMMIVCSSGGIPKDGQHGLLRIYIDNSIRAKFPEIYNLLQDSIISNRSRKYQFRIFPLLSSKKSHELYIKEDSLAIEVGGETKLPYYTKGTYETFVKDTIFLNSNFLENSSKEYVVQVVIHESIHAFINWCKL